MRRFLRLTLACMLLAVVCYPALVLLFRYGLGPAGAIFQRQIVYDPNGPGHTKTRLAEAAAFGRVDVLFIGSSHVYRGIDVREVEREGWRAFNLGSSSQTPIHTRLLLERFLPRLRPRLVVIDVNPVLLGDGGAEATLDLLAADPEREKYPELVRKNLSPKLFNALLLAHLDDWLGIDHGGQPRRINQDTYVSGGYVEKEAGYHDFTPSPAAPATIVPRTDQVNALRKAVERCREAGAGVLLISMPVSEAYGSFYTPLNGLDSLLPPSAPFVDFRGEDRWNSEAYFFDAHHLNQTGATAFTRTLTDSLMHWVPPPGPTSYDPTPPAAAGDR